MTESKNLRDQRDLREVKRHSAFAVRHFFTIFTFLKKLHISLAYILLMVFSWAMIPTHTLHDLFADHEDTDEGYCAAYHAHLGLHVEKKHTHCEILKTNTPVYDQPSFSPFQKAENILFASFVTSIIERITEQHFFSLSDRGPPAV